MVAKPRKRKIEDDGGNDEIVAQPAYVLAAQLDAIIERLPSLRAQGVTRIQVGDVDLQIEPPAPEAQPRHPAAPPDDFLDPSKFRRNRNESADLDDE